MSYRESAQAGQRVGRYSREVGPSGNVWNSGKLIVFMLVPVLPFVKILYVVLAPENDGFFYLDGVAGVIASGPPCGKTLSASVNESCSPLVRC